MSTLKENKPSWREMADAAALYVVNAGINTGLKSAGIANSSSLQDRLIRDAVEGEADALVQSAVMGTKFDPFSQVGVMAGSDIAFEYGHVGEVKDTLSTMMSSSDNTAKTQSTEIQSLTGVYLPVPAGVTDPGQTQMTSNGHIAQAAPATPEDSAQFASKVKALGLSTDISEGQWIQSAMGYNRNTTAFNYTQNATSIPSMQLDYSRFMDSVMTASQPTIKYPAYAASNPSSVQPTAQGVGGGSVWAAIPKGLGETWDDLKNSVKGAWGDVKSAGARAWHDVTNPADLISDIQKLGDNLLAYERRQELGMGISAAYAMMPATAEGRSNLMAPIKAYLSEPAALEVEQATHFVSKIGLFAAATVLTDGAVDYVAGSEISLSRFSMFGRSNTNLYHTVTNPRSVQSILNGIDISFSDPLENRFGQGFYLSESPDVTIAELSYHGSEGADTIRYSYNSKAAKVLDLTKPKIAQAWGYTDSASYSLSQSIAERAVSKGFNAIRFNSARAEGVNFVIFDNFENILKPKMVIPTPSMDEVSGVSMNSN